MAATLCLLLGTAGLIAAPVPPRPREPAPEKAAAGKGSQLQPAFCRLGSGAQLLAFEWLETAHKRKVYVKRRRPRQPWGYGQEVPMSPADFSHRHPSLVALSGGAVLLFLQAGDSRRKQGSVRQFEAALDSLKFQDRGILSLGLPPGSAVTSPFATPDGRGGVLLTVTRTGGGIADGCHLFRAADGRRFFPVQPAALTGPSELCRTVALGGKRLALTFQSRTSRRDPFVGQVQISEDGGATWGAAVPVARNPPAQEVMPIAGPGGTLHLVFVRTRQGRSELYRSTLPAGGSLTPPTRILRAASGRDLSPFGVLAPSGLEVFFVRESTPLDFDVLQVLLPGIK